MVAKYRNEKIKVGRFYFWLYTNNGRFLEVLGLVEDDSRGVLKLADLQVFTVWGTKAYFGPRITAQCRSEFKRDLIAAGFHKVEISFSRISGANPGRSGVLTMQLI
ncbi:hypothetical protein VDR65_01790 [Xanthomonas campestris pv. campestris]|nr:hypothetical protein [Xanthomonas campestris pv. campestris]